MITPYEARKLAAALLASTARFDREANALFDLAQQVEDLQNEVARKQSALRTLMVNSSLTMHQIEIISEAMQACATNVK